MRRMKHVEQRYALPLDHVQDFSGYATVTVETRDCEKQVGARGVVHDAEAALRFWPVLHVVEEPPSRAAIAGCERERSRLAHVFHDPREAFAVARPPVIGLVAASCAR